MTAKRLPSFFRDEAQHAAQLGAELLSRLHPLFLASAAIRGTVAILLVLAAVYVLNLLGTSDLVAWLVLGLTSGGLAIVMLDDALDLEGKVAEQVAKAAVFKGDRFGVRAAAVWTYADDRLRIQGRIPHARAHIRQPGSEQLFRVYFPTRAADCLRWSARALLASLHNALRFVAVGLTVVVVVQLYFLSAG